jgi:hypothetical protein
MNDIERHDTLDSSERAVVEAGAAAWNTLGKTWNFWLQVAEALDIGRNHCMRMCHTNRPEGAAYNSAMAWWLERNGFENLGGKDNSATRSDLARCLENRAAIETWRAGLTDKERAKWNNPSTVLREWKKATKDKPPRHALTKDEIITNMEAELTRLRRERGDDVFFSPNDRASDIADVLCRQINEGKLLEVIKACFMDLDIPPDVQKRLKDEARAIARKSRA